MNFDIKIDNKIIEYPEESYMSHYNDILVQQILNKNISPDEKKREISKLILWHNRNDGIFNHDNTPFLDRLSRVKDNIIELPSPKMKVDIESFVFNVKEKESFLKDIKQTFSTERGISLKIMIELLKDAGMIKIGNMKFKEFYKELKIFMDRDIGKYQALNDQYKHTEDNKKYYSKEINIVKSKLNPLIERHKLE